MLQLNAEEDAAKDGESETPAIIHGTALPVASPSFHLMVQCGQ